MTFLTIKYGESPDQFATLYPPTQGVCESQQPIVTLIHGGFWKQKYSIDNALIDNLVPFFQSHGYWVSLLEYRRGNDKDGGEGGWPTTNEDIILALHCLFDFCNNNQDTFTIDYQCTVNWQKCTIIGHSAGGTLALWLCCSQLSSSLTIMNSPILKLPFSPLLCVAIAPVGNLVLGHERRLSDEGDAIPNYMKCIPEIVIEEGKEKNGEVCHDSPYRLASPHFLLPLSTNTLLVAGDKDSDVPADLVQTFYEDCQRHSFSQDHSQEQQQYRLQFLLLKDTDHYQLVQSTSSAWQSIFETMKSFE